MALQFLPILKALPTLISSAGGIIASVNARKESSAVLKAEERIKRLEEDVLNTGKVLGGLAEQVQAIAQELRTYAELNESRARRLRALLWLAVGACVTSSAALAVALFG